MKHSKEMSKNMKVALGAVVVVVLIGLIAWGASHKKDTGTKMSPEPQMQQSPEAPKPPRASGSTPKPTLISVDSRGYAELVLAYKDKMLQFGPSCQVRLNNQVYKLGSEILLDNRTNAPVSIKLAGATYDLSAYGYKVVVLNTEGKFMVGCGANQNVATVTVQK